MGKTFDQYKAEHAHEPFELPMPDGKPALLPKASIKQSNAVAAAAEAARQAGEPTTFAGLEVLVGEAEAARIADAWGALPPEAWVDAMKDRAEHFGEGN